VRTRTTLAAAATLVVGALLGWLIASGRLTTSLAQDKSQPTATGAQTQPAKEPGRGGEPPKDGKKPNIVFILLDNLGYGEVGCYGGGVLRGAPTPRIDKLATEGLRLLNFNVEAQCTPSRSAIMTGRFAIRAGTHTVPIGGGLDGLTQWEVTIAELLSGAGYSTGHFGKWHLGSEDGSGECRRWLLLIVKSDWKTIFPPEKPKPPR
jgi:arylsulfatase A-like enzyme